MSTPAVFNPSPSLEAQILDAIISESHSLASIATLAATTTQALCLWLTKPAIQGRLASIESTAAWRIRVTATIHLEASIAAILKVLTNPTLNALAFPNQVSQASQPSRPAAQNSSPQTRHSELSTPHSLTPLRAAESIRRSASTLIRLARFKPIGPWVPRLSEPAPRVPRLSEPGVSTSTGSPPLGAGSSFNARPTQPNPAPPPPREQNPVPTTAHRPNHALTALLATHLAASTPDAEAEALRSLGFPPTSAPDFSPPPRPHKPGPRSSAAPLNPAANLLQSAGSARGP